jgi:hypothetical protein
MANFCVKCGSPLTSGPFCTKCGTRSPLQSGPAQPGSIPAQPAPAVSPAQTGPQPVEPAPATPQPALTKAGMSSFAKFVIAAVVIIFVGGAAAAVVGLYYVAHRVSQKVHQVSDKVLRSDSDSSSSDNASSSDSSASSDNSLGDVCRFLSKEDVSKAIGVKIIRAQNKDNGCSYIAKGTQADVMAKHASAMTASRGADKKTQQLVQQFAGGMFNQFQSERPQSEWDKSGEVLVFNFSLDQHAAEAQMRLNAKVMGRIGDMQDLPGIGDQAFVSGDGMIMVRKGDKLVRIMYLTCPCGTEAVKPLAKEIADAL